MGEIHELFVLALSLVWFAGATPEPRGSTSTPPPLLPNLHPLDCGAEGAEGKGLWGGGGRSCVCVYMYVA